MPVLRNPTRDGYVVVCGGVMTDVMDVVRAHGLAVGVDIDPGYVPFDALNGPHKIRISYGVARRVVAVDHATFMSAEGFRMVVLKQVQAALEELAAHKH